MIVVDDGECHNEESDDDQQSDDNEADLFTPDLKYVRIDQEWYARVDAKEPPDDLVDIQARLRPQRTVQRRELRNKKQQRDEADRVLLQRVRSVLEGGGNSFAGGAQQPVRVRHHPLRRCCHYYHCHYHYHSFL